MIKIFIWPIVLGMLLFLSSCHRNPITGRNQLSLVSENDVQSMALVQYAQFLSTNKVVTEGNDNSQMVKRVGNRIAEAIGRYYAEHGNAGAVSNYKWEFNLVENNQVNAWCMPGGKVVVYTGLLALTQ